MTDSGRQLREAARRFGRHQTSRILLGALGRGIGVGLAVTAVLLLIDRLAPLPALVRLVGALLVLFAIGAFVAAAFIRRWSALRNLEETARETERQSEELRDRLVPALQVLRVRDESRTGYSSELVDAFVNETTDRVQEVKPAELPYNEGFRRGLIGSAIGVGALLVAVAFLGWERSGASLMRLATAFTDVGPSPDATFFVEPGDVSIPRGEQVALSARIENATIRDGQVRASIQWRSDEKAPWNERILIGEEFPIPRVEHEFSEVRETFRYRFAHGKDVSSEYTVDAVPHPSLSLDEVRYHYPEYTGLTDRVVRDGSGDLSAVKGSRATILVRSTNKPRSASLVLDSGETKELTIDEEGRLVAELTILEEDSYHLTVEDELGLENQNPLHYRVRALQDEAPFIRLLEPGEDRDLDESLQVTLRYSAVDDYGIGPVRLVFELSRREGEIKRAEIFRPSARRNEITGTHEWSLEDLGLLPGDTITYHLEVEDNNAIDGPSSGRTREYILRFPTLGEIYAEIDEKEEGSIEDLQEVAEEARRVEEKIEEISREILKRGDSSWENNKEVERALESQQKLAEELNRVQDEIESNLQRLSESEFMTFEAFEKMERIQQLMDEVVSEEMKDALEKLREAMEEANPRRMQEDLAEFQMTQEELMKQLDRIIENLKQFRLEERMKAAVRQMEELAARQERVNDELGEKTDESQAPDEREPSEESAAKDEEAKDPTEGDSEGKESSENEDTKGEKDSELADSEGKENSGDEKGESSESEESKSDESKSSEELSKEDLEQLAREEEALAEEARRLEEELKELAEMTQELRDAQDSQGMKELSEQMESGEIPETMGDMAEKMEGGDQPGAQEQGEKALTELQRMLDSLTQMQQGMSMRMIAISQAAINRAVRDLLAVSHDEESLSIELDAIPRNSSSATRSFADEQFLLLQGTERVEEMLHEVAKDTPLMDSRVGRKLDSGIDAMKGAASGLENGAVHLAQDDGERAVEDLNAVVIALLETAKSMSSCSSGMPMSGAMQRLQELAGDQDKLNQMLQELMKEGGSSLDQRLQGKMRSLAEEQQRIAEELQQLLDEIGEGGQGMLGRLDDVSDKLDEIAERLSRGELDEETLREQNWALTRLLDSQRAMRERELGQERKSETGEDLADLLPPSALPKGLEEEKRNLREDLLKALDRRYPPKYEELIRRYFRSLSDEAPGSDLP